MNAAMNPSNSHTASQASQKLKSREKISYPTLFWLFLVGSVLGFVVEGLWCIVLTGHWENHSATVWGPFCIIYGIGAVAVYLLSVFLKHTNLLMQFAIFSLSGGAVEYFGSLFQEVCFGSVSWDYSDHPLNLDGRVSLQMALAWGILGVLFIRLIFPVLSRLLAKMTGKGWKIACVLLSLFMAVNLLLSAAAVSRWKTRQDNPKSSNPVIQWLDNTYNDQRMETLFPNLHFQP